MLASEVMDYRKRVLGPAAAAAVRIFSSPEGKLVLDALDRVFARDLVATDKDGRVDPAGVLVRAGNKEVVDYLRGLAENKEDGE